MKKLTYEYIKEYMKNEGYELLSTEYKNNRSKLTVKCPHGHIIDTMTFSNFKKGIRCKYCSKIGHLTQEFVENEFAKNGHKLIDKYINANTPIHVICKNGHDWYPTYGNYSSGKGCGKCANNQTLEYEYVKNEIRKEGCELLSKEYINGNTPLIIHWKCGHITNTSTWANFRRGEGCKICNASKGELKIKYILDNLHIEYYHDKPYFPDLVSSKGNSLRPDFIIPTMKLWIEYDGEQHFEWVKGMMTYNDFLNLQENDKRKNQYANKHGWKLIRIAYWEFDNIETILNNELNN